MQTRLYNSTAKPILRSKAITTKTAVKCQDLAATQVVHLVTLDLREVEGGWKGDFHTALCTTQNPPQSLCKNIKEDLEFCRNPQHIKPFFWFVVYLSWNPLFLNDSFTKVNVLLKSHSAFSRYLAVWSKWRFCWI